MLLRQALADDVDEARILVVVMRADEQNHFEFVGLLRNELNKYILFIRIKDFIFQLPGRLFV